MAARVQTLTDNIEDSNDCKKSSLTEKVLNILMAAKSTALKILIAANSANSG